MPNLHGVASWLPAAGVVEIGAAVAVMISALDSPCRRTRGFGMAGAAVALAA